MQLWLDILALLAGLLLPLAFAPFNHSIFALLSPAVLLFIISKTPNKIQNKRAFYRGFLYGLGQFGLGISWVYISMSVYGGFGKPLAFIITCLLVFLLSLFPACQIYILQRFFPENNNKKYLLAFPASWAITEYLRTIIGTGFPWLLLGYTQINTPLHTLAPIIGVYGLSFMTCYTSAVGFILLTQKGFYKSKIIILLSIIILWATAVLISPIQWTQPGKNLQVSLVQGNISQQLKWEPQELTRILKTYYNLTIQHWNSQLIIWPEAAIPVLANQVEDYLNNLSKKSKKHQVSLLIGVPLLKNNYFYNAVISLGNAKNTYLKHHLVPFGEYIPFENYLKGLFNWLHIPMSDLSPGPNSKKQDLLLAHNISIAAFICYEIAYPTQVLEAVSKGAELLITLTDDSWFGHSFAPAQHLQIAQMRALETGKYLLFSTNTGITAIIQPDGSLQASLPDFQQAVLTGKIYAMQGNTPLVYISHHRILIFFLVLLILIATFESRVKNYA